MARLALASEPTLSVKLLLTAIILVLVPDVTSGPTGGRETPKCVSFCKETSKLGFTEGRTFYYDYKTDISTSVLGGSGLESRIHLTAKAEFSAITPCEIQLELKHVQLEESEPENRRALSPVPNAREIINELQHRPLRFSFQDGKIENICATESDPIWVLNIKRGIISTLQNTMDRLTEGQATQEVDVSGRCFTKYEPFGQSIKKTKDLKGCGLRHSHVSAIQSVAYTSNSPTQTIPLLSGTQECIQTIRNKRIEKVECSEEHVFQPFENSPSGGKTVVTQQLVFTGSDNTPSSSSDYVVSRTASLLFETPQAAAATATDINSMLAILESLERESVPQVTNASPDRFIELVEELRMINYDALRTLYSRASTKVGQKFLLDAMPLVGSAPSLAFMTDLYNQGKLTENQIDSWLTSLSFIKHPRVEMIAALQSMLEGEPRNQALLGISSVVYSYCQNHENCIESTPVQDILKKIVSYLGPSCKAGNYDNEEVTRMLFVLKAIGNAGRVPVESLPLLQNCFKEKSSPVEIKLAAVDAFRRMPCGTYNHAEIVKQYTTMNGNTELRIHAYLVAMKCPDRELIDAVKDTLYTDAVNQVGSFVWTHLTNLQETSSPDKQAIRELLSNDFLKNKFNTDARKYSRNYEGATYWEQQNVGAGVDANLIFSPESFLPRAAMVNLTCHLFGESVNLLEFGARVHDLEQLLEPVFGPNGYFPDKTLNEALYTMRTKRDTSSNAIQRLGAVYNQAGGNGENLAGGSFYTRIFGNEISYKSFEVSQGSSVPTLIDENGHNWLDITRLFDNLSTGKSVEYTKSTVMMDSSYTVATSAGIPLSLGIQSAATVGLKASGKVDLTHFWETRELEIEGVLRPSGAVQVYGIMSVQLGKFNSKVRSGLKLQNTLHTSTAVEARVGIKGNKVIHTSLTLPQTKQEIFEAKSQLLIIRASGKPAVVEQGSSATPASHHKFCTPSALSNAVGVQLCGEATIPEQFTFPLQSPAAISLYLEKTDEFDKYEFDYKWAGDEDKTDVSILFNTPGSKVDRRLAAAFFFDRSVGKMEGSFEAPTKSFHVEGRYTDSSQSFQVTVKSSDEQVLMLSAALRLQGSRMEPNFLVLFYKKPVVEIQGVVDLQNIADQDGKANFDLTFKHLTQSPIQLNGEVAKNGEMYDTQLGIQSYLATGTVRSQFRVRDGLISCKSEVVYEWKKAPSKTVSVSGKLQRTSKGALAKYSAQASLTSSQHPDTDIEISWETQKSRGYCENTGKLVWGKSSWEGKALYKTQFSRGAQDIQFQVSMLAPKNGIDYNLEFVHLKSDSGIMTKLSGRTDSKNELRAQMDYLSKKEKLMDKSLKLEVTWPRNEYTLRSSVKEVRTGEFEGELIIIPNRVAEKKATFSYRNKSARTKLDHSVEFRARGFIPEPVTATASLSASDKLSHVGFQMEIEGRKKYSGRWTGNLDYNSSKKNLNKFEGKLALNERKYTGEVNFRQTKSGEHSVNLDVKVHSGRHIYGEMKMKGSLASKFSASASIIPDRAANPTRKASFEGTLNGDSANIRLNYFGDVTAVSGTYNHEKVKFEAEWDNTKRVSMSIDTPSMNAQRAVIISSLDTTFEGLRNLGFTLEHNYDGNQLSTLVGARMGPKTAELSLGGSKTATDLRATFTAQATGFEKLTSSVDLIRTNNRNKFETTIQLGNERTTLTIENTPLPGGQANKIDFTGCSFVPKFLIEASHQATNEVETIFKMQWTPSKSYLRQMNFQLSGQKNPMSYRFMLTTPWKSMEKFDGTMALKKEKQDLGLELYLNGGLSVMPLRLNVRVSGSRQNFKHQLDMNWSANKVEKSALFSAQGRLMSFKDSSIKVVVDVPQHQYQVQLASQAHQKQEHKVDFEAIYDNERIGSGITWFSENSGKKLKASVWVEYPAQPKIMINIEHNRTDKSFMITSSFGQGENHENHFNVQLDHEGFKKWNLEANVDSSLNFIPTLKMTSKHSMTGWREVQHISSLSLEQKSTKHWGGKDEQKASIEFNVREGRNVDGALTYNEKDIKLTGQVQFEQKTKQVDFQITSPMFETLRAIGGYEKNNQERSINFAVSRKGAEILNLKSSGRRENGKLAGTFSFKCPFGHQIESEVTLDFAQRSLKCSFHENQKQLIHLTFEAQALSTRGKLFIDMQSKLNRMPDKLTLDVNYKKDSNQVELQGSYTDAHGQSSLSGVGVYTPELKKLQFTMNGKNQLTYDFELLGSSKLTASAAYNGNSLGSIEANYRNEQGEFALGKHIVNVKVVNQKRKTYDFSTTLGVDLNRIMLDIQTPFDSVKEFTISAEMILENTRKTGALGFKLNGQRYDGKLELRISDNNGKLSIQVRTPIKGYTALQSEIEYTFAASSELKFNALLERSRMSFTWLYSPEKAEIEIYTPFEAVKHIQASAQWNFKNTNKFLSASAQLNEMKYEINSKWSLSSTQGQLNVSMTGFENANFELKYDFIQDYNVNAALDIFGKRHGIGGRVKLGNQDIHVEVHAPFLGLENASAKAEYKSPSTGRHHKVLEWNMNGKAERIELMTTLNAQGIQFNLKTPFHPWNTVSGSLQYNLQQADKEITLKAERGDGKSIEFNLKTQMQGYLYQLRGNFKSSITMELQTPITGMEKWQMEAAYTRQGIRHTGKFVAQKNSEAVNGRFTIVLQRNEVFHMDLDSEFSAPVFGLKVTRLGGSVHVDLQGESKLTGVFGYADKKYEVDGSFNMQPSQMKLEGRSSFSSLKQFQFLGRYDNSGNFVGSFEVNEKRVELELKVSQNGIRNSKIVCELKTPFNGYKSIYAESEINVQPRSGRLSFSFQNDHVRYMGKAEGHYSKEHGEFKVQFNSPVYRYEQILASMQYSSTGAQAKLERNTKEEVNAEIALNEGTLLISLVSKFPSYPINTKSVIDWSKNPLTLRINLDAGSKDNVLSVQTNIDGPHSGEVQVTTSFKGYENLNVKWQMEGNAETGVVSGSFDIPKLGKKSLRSSWKREDFQAMKLELWLNSGTSEHDKGFTLQYSLASAKTGGGKLGASLTYVFDKKEEQVTISTALKRADPTNTFEFTLQTPFKAVKDITINGRLITKPDISVDLTASHNQEKVMTVQTVVSINTLVSKFKLSFNAPKMSDPFSMNADYDLTTSDKTMEIFFQQNKYKLNVKAQAIVPNNPQEIELRMHVDSNVPSVTVSASGSLRAGYKIETDGTRQVSVAVDSEHTGHWSAVASVRALPNFNAKFRLESPVPEKISSIKGDIEWTSSREGVNSGFSMQMGRQEIRSTLVFGPEKLRATFNSPFPGLEEFLIDGKLESGQGNLNKKASMQVRAGEKYARLEGEILVPSQESTGQASLKLESAWEQIPEAHLRAKMEKNGNLDISGKWGERILRVGGNVSPRNGKSLKKSAEAQISVELDGHELFQLHSNHYFDENQYSWNASLRPQYKFESFVEMSDAKNVLKAKIQWDRNQEFQINGDVGSGRFGASLSTPWSKEMQTNGQYTISSEEYSARGYVTYDGVRSGLEAQVRTGKDSFVSRVNVNIPILSQKLEASINIQKPDEKNVLGDLVMKMHDREVSVKGSLLTNKYQSSQHGKMVEQTLKLSISLPNSHYSDMNTELVLRKPERSFANMQIEASVSLPTQTSKVAFRYEIPTESSKTMAAEWLIDSRLVSTEIIKGAIQADNVSLKNFDGQLRYKNNEIKVLWDLSSKFRLEASVHMPELLQEFSPLRFSAEGNLEWPNELRIRSTASCNKSSSTLEASIVKQAQGYNTRFFIDSPRTMKEPQEILVKFQQAENGRYVVDLSGVRGKKSFSAVGELIAQNSVMSVSGKVSGSLGAHYVQVSGNRNGRNFEVEMNAESLSLLNGKKVTISGNLRPTQTGFISNFECRTKKSVHSMSINADFQERSGIISMKLNSPGMEPMLMEAQYTSDQAEMRGKLMANVMGEQHQFEASVNKRDLELKLNLQCPYLRTEFNAHAKCVVQKNNVNIIGDLRFNAAHWRLEGTAKYDHVQNMEAKLEVVTPFQSFDRVTIGGKIAADEVLVELYTPLEDFPNSMFRVKGLPLFDYIDPMNIHPHLTIGFPWATYSAGGSFQVPNQDQAGKFGIMYELKYSKETPERYEGYIHTTPLGKMSFYMTEPMKIRFEGKTPIEGFKVIDLELAGDVQWKSWADLKAVCEFKGKKIMLTSQVRNEAGNKKISIELTTPLKKYERFAILGHIENYEEIGAGQSIQLEFQHPQWKTPVNVELDYRYHFNGLGDLEGELKLASPSMEIEPLLLRLKSVLKDSLYSGLVEGTWGEQRPVLKIEAGTSEGTLFASIEGKSGLNHVYQALSKFELIKRSTKLSLSAEVQYNYHQLLSTLLALSKESHVLEAEARIKTPYEYLRSGAVVLRLSPVAPKDSITFDRVIKNLDVTAGASYNGKKLIHVELVSRNGRRSLEVHNPFQPVSLSVHFERQEDKKLDVLAEVCWNLKNPIESTLGLGLTYDRRDAAQDVTFKVHAGEKGLVDVSLSHALTPTLLEQSFKIKWNRPDEDQDGEAGYSVYFKDGSSPDKKAYEVRGRLDMPWRSVEVESQISSSEQEEYSKSVELKWDVKRDASKRLGGKLVREKRTAWRSHVIKQSLTLIHSALPHDVTFTMAKNYRNNAVQLLELTLQPNSFPQDQLTFRFARGTNKNPDIHVALSHPSTNIDINVIVKDSDATKSVHLSHMDIHGQKYVLNMEATKDNQGAMLDINAGPDTDVKPVFQLEYRPLEEQQMFSLKSAPMDISVDVNNVLPHMKASVKYDSGREMNFQAGLPHAREITLKFSRSEYGMNIKDLLMSIKLNTSHLLSTNVHWRPEMLQDLKQAFTSGLPKWFGIYDAVEYYVPRILTILNDEVEERLAALDPAFVHLVKSFKDYTSSELQVVQAELERLVKLVHKMHNKNSFYLKDITGFVSSTYQTIIDLGEDSFTSVRNVVHDLLKAGSQAITQVKKMWKEYGDRLENIIMPLWDKAEKAIEHIWKENFKTLSDLVDALRDLYETLKHVIEGNMEALEKKIRGVGIIRKVNRLYREYAAWIEELPIQKYIDVAEEMLKNRILVPLERYYKPYFEALNKAFEERNLIALLEMPPLPYFRHITYKVSGLFSRVWIFVEAEQKIKGLVRDVLNRIDSMIQRHIPTATMVWDTQKGNIAYHQPLSVFEWQDFTQMPQFKQTAEDAADENKITEFYFNMLDTIRSTEPIMQMSMREILPPFGAQALMAGDHHYYTFDKKYFRFAGECSYVLVADLLHQNFTLVVNYENREGALRKKSYSLLSGDRVLEIDTNSLKVSVNGKKAELPLEVGSTFIRRQPSGLEIFDSRGFQMRCTESPSICSISVSGWYFGKLGGLLGTYDNEAANDMKTPDGQVVTEVSNFAHSWRVGNKVDQCRMKNFAVENSQDVDVDGVCNQMLTQKNSPLRPCFNVVDPTVFMQMCMHDTSRNINSANREESMCTAIGAYVKECQTQGIDLWMPPACVRCKLEDGSSLTSGENATFALDEPMVPVKSADIVFLVEEAASLRGYNLNEAVSKLDAALKAEGLMNNRYSVVGFGGKGPRSQPHIRTSAGQVWAHSTVLKISDPDSMTGTGNGDLYEAMEYAATIGYRAGVSKTMIALVADNDRCGDESRYADALTLLLENDFRLHMLTPEDFTMKTAKKQEDATTVFGVDIEGVYTIRNANRPMEPDSSLKRHVKISKDFCTPLAVETTGTRFNIKQMQRFNKKFIDVWSRRVAKTSQPSDCQRCECLPNRNGGNMLMCHQCVSPNLQKFMDDFSKYEQMGEHELLDPENNN